MAASAGSKSAQKARRAFSKAHQFQNTGRFQEAAQWYRRSIELHPTVEAYTALGWVLSCLAQHEQAIQECLAAVALDSTAGQPCNDIGAYLLEIGRTHEAIPWLKRACWAGRCDCRHFAHFNLGRAYEALGMWELATEAYREALCLRPAYGNADRALRRLRAQMN